MIDGRGCKFIAGDGAIEVADMVAVAAVRELGAGAIVAEDQVGRRCRALPVSPTVIPAR
jgi:hypothetical protein